MTSSRLAPPAWRMAWQFVGACRVWSWSVSPARLPVSGSMPTMPETSTCGPALTPWLYSGDLGAFAVVMTCRGTIVLPVSPPTNGPQQDRRFHLLLRRYVVPGQLATSSCTRGLGADRHARRISPGQLPFFAGLERRAWDSNPR